MNVLVRAAAVADLDEVVRISADAEGAPQWDVARYREMLAGQDGALYRVLLVAEIDVALVGFVVASVVLDVGELESIAVKAAARRRGVGRALCEAAAAWARGLGAVEMRLEVRSANGPALAMYRALGFEAMGMRRGYYREPEDDAVLMRLKTG